MATSPRYSWLRRSLLLVFCLLAALSLGGLFGQWAWWLDLCAHFRWQYLAAALLLGVLAAVLRAWPAVVLAALVGGFNAMLIWPKQPSTSVSRAAGQTRVSLVNANLWASNRDLTPFLGWLQQQAPDIVVVQELTVSAQVQLEAALEALGLRAVIAVPAADAFGIGVWTRLPVRSAQLRELGPHLLSTIHAELLTADGRALDVFATHPLPPIGAGGTAARNAQLRELALWVAERPRGAVVLAGDFNASPWSSALRELHTTLALTSGTHLDWPWPTWKPPSAGLLGWLLAVPIDHVLLRGAQLLENQLGPDIGSDHRPLRVLIGLPRLES